MAQSNCSRLLSWSEEIDLHDSARGGALFPAPVSYPGANLTVGDEVARLEMRGGAAR